MINKLIYTHQSGLSLIEAMIAAMVVGVGLLGLAKLQNDIFVNVGENRVQIMALHFAQQKMEMLRGFSTLTEFNGFSTGDESCDPSQVVLGQDSPCVGINATLNRNSVKASCLNAMPCQKLTLTVTWDSPDGASQNYSPPNAYIVQTEPVDAGVAIAGP